MELNERDKFTDHMTTGHEWNGIKELNAPVPRVVWLCLGVLATFGIIWTLLMPSWPGVSGYFRGLLGVDHRVAVEQAISEAAVEKAACHRRFRLARRGLERPVDQARDKPRLRALRCCALGYRHRDHVRVWEQVLFPALAGFLVVGPVLATGLYEKSRRLATGEPINLSAIVWPRQGAGQHLFYVGAILMTLMLVWMRAAVLLYALFFGWRPFPGFDRVVEMLFTTPTGLAMLVTGTAVGGLFAAFAFAISVFSIPMLLDRRLDAFSAMGTSMSLVWNNLPALLIWGAIVLALTLVSLATGLAGLIVIFPLLGHASWHAYAAVRG